jgi:hypothetical protein
MNQPHPTVAAIDPQRERVPLLLSHYTLPSLYHKARAFVEKEQYVPAPLATVNVYYNERYGGQFVDHWRKHTGPDIYAHASWRIHSMMSRDIEELSHPDCDSNRYLIPLPSLMPIKLFQTALAFQDPNSLTVVWEAYTHYLSAVDNVPDLKHMGELLYEPFAMLDAYKHRLTPAVLSNYYKLLQFALSRQTLPAQSMAIALSEYEENEIGSLALNFTNMPLPGRPTLDDIDAKRTPTQAMSEDEGMIEVTADVLNPEDLVDEYIDQADGSKGLSARKTIKQLFSPRFEYNDDPQAMFDTVCDAHKGIWLDTMHLWWKTLRPREDAKTEAHSAWVLDSTIRFLEHAFTEEQFSVLTEVVAAQEITDWCQSFVLGVAGKEPDLSWQQMRISILALPMARIARITETPLIDFAVELYEAADLHDEIHLLRVTLDLMSEELDDQLAKMQASIKRNKDASRH